MARLSTGSNKSATSNTNLDRRLADLPFSVTHMGKCTFAPPVFHFSKLTAHEKINLSITTLCDAKVRGLRR